MKTKHFDLPIKVVTQAIDGQEMYGVELLESPYEGIIISYGRIEFDPDEENDRLDLRFEYELHRDNGEEYDKKEFENYIGNLLTEMIHQELSRRELIYTGGTDDDRENNFEQSDLQRDIFSEGDPIS